MSVKGTDKYLYTAAVLPCPENVKSETTSANKLAVFLFLFLYIFWGGYYNFLWKLYVENKWLFSTQIIHNSEFPTAFTAACYCRIYYTLVDIHTIYCLFLDNGPRLLMCILVGNHN